jgi:hypothetical protein
LFVYTQPVPGSHVSVVQTLLSLHANAGPPVHTPAVLHESFVVQAFPSSQLRSGTGVYTHPEPGLHVSSVHGLWSSQTTAVPGWQDPPPQVSPDVQAFPSSHGLVLLT